MKFTITTATADDLPMICHLFEEAIRFQKARNYPGWNNYDKEYIKDEISKGLLYKMVSDDEIICLFSICYHDRLIWREKENGTALYLHRIVLNRSFKGEKIFKYVLGWAIAHAGEKLLSHIRMDTWADNEKIIGYYMSYGFSFIENYTTPDSGNLPVQHRNLKVALLEYKLPVPEKPDLKPGIIMAI